SVRRESFLMDHRQMGLFIAEGHHWRWQRRAAAPVFAMRNIRNLAPIMEQAAKRSVERVASHPERTQNLHAEMIAATFDVISDVTFSSKGVFDRDAVHKAIDDYLDQTAQISIFDIMGMPDWIPRPGRLLRSSSNRELKRIADAAIDSRLATTPPIEGDLFHLLSMGEDPRTSRRMNRTELRDNLLTFIVAGHETTALTLSWALYLLACNQDWQKRVREEIHTVLGGQTARPDDLDRLVLTRQVLQEALRLYPPAALLLRVALADDTVGGREIRRGDSILLPIYALHRNVCWWSDPDAFDPGRFAPDIRHERDTYLPFGEGPRICIGAGFAMQEAMIIMTALIGRFAFSLVPGRIPDPVMVLTLRPADGIWLDVQPVA
ncbi:MAG: cytochrome P450, partial [Rhodobacteraceae bacterium]|nr:cytochrome P450 [Paracoccaceae bacterium]